MGCCLSFREGGVGRAIKPSSQTFVCNFALMANSLGLGEGRMEGYISLGKLEEGGL